MESELQKLINLSIPTLYRIRVKENPEEYSLDDSIVIKTATSLVQVFITDNCINVKNASSISDLVVWDTFDKQNAEIHLSVIKSFINPSPVSCIHIYTQGDTYTFGVKFLDKYKTFITALSLGFDELLIVDNQEFESMTLRYSNGEIPVNIKVIS